MKLAFLRKTLLGCGLQVRIISIRIRVQNRKPVEVFNEA